MTASALSEKLFTVEKYIEFEELSDIRHEYHFGKLYAMAGTSNKHNEVTQNIVAALRPEFKRRKCKIFVENLKLQIVEKGQYTYPDIMVTCHDFDKKATYIIRYPSLVVEVLSQSTAAYDRGDKFRLYQKVDSIQYYLLVDSRSLTAELYSRTEHDNLWTYQIFTELTDVIELPKLDFKLPLLAIYEDMTFEPKIWFSEEKHDESDNFS